jgi:hypothetical protein
LIIQAARNRIICLDAAWPEGTGWLVDDFLSFIFGELFFEPVLEFLTGIAERRRARRVLVAFEMMRRGDGTYSGSVRACLRVGGAGFRKGMLHIDRASLVWRSAHGNEKYDLTGAALIGQRRGGSGRRARGWHTLVLRNGEDDAEVELRVLRQLLPVVYAGQEQVAARRGGVTAADAADGSQAQPDG